MGRRDGGKEAAASRSSRARATAHRYHRPMLLCVFCVVSGTDEGFARPGMMIDTMLLASASVLVGQVPHIGGLGTRHRQEGEAKGIAHTRIGYDGTERQVDVECEEC
eukprot:3411457-Rhodomonas_salina.1